jgi:hypothetical protein
VDFSTSKPQNSNQSKTSAHYPVHVLPTGEYVYSISIYTPTLSTCAS